MNRIHPDAQDFCRIIHDGAYSMRRAELVQALVRAGIKLRGKTKTEMATAYVRHSEAAISQFTTELKSAGIWEKMQVIYPFGPVRTAPVNSPALDRCRGGR